MEKIHNFCPQKFPVRQFITKILNFAMLTEPEILLDKESIDLKVLASNKFKCKDSL